MRGRQPFTRRVPLPRLPHLASGQVMIIFAMAALVLVGFVALSVDTGFLMAEKRQTQSAADAAALAGAAEGEGAAKEVAAANGAELIGWRTGGTDVWVVVVLGDARGEARARRDG